MEPQAAASKEPLKERATRVDWAELLRRTFDLEGMMMVMKDGHVTVVPKEGEKQAFYAGYDGEIGNEMPRGEPTGCLGCH